MYFYITLTKDYYITVWIISIHSYANWF